jgi:hypothetical protein
METKFEAQWPMKGVHIVKIIAYSMPSLVPAPGFRQFDLHIDGMSFFDMDKIYQLGGGSKNHSVDRVVSSSSSYTSQHTKDRRGHEISAANHQGRSFGSPSGHSTSTIDSLSSTLQQDFLDNYPAVHYKNSAHHDAFAPVTPELSSFQTVSNQVIMDSYNNNTMAPTNNSTAVRLCNDVPNMITSTKSMTPNTNHDMAQFYSNKAVASCGIAPYGGAPLAPRVQARDPCMNGSTQYTAFSQPIDQPTRLSSLPPTSTFRPVAQWNKPNSGSSAMHINHAQVTVTPGSMPSFPVNQSSFSPYNGVNSHQFRY